MFSRIFESKFFVVMGKFLDVVVLSILWCVTSLPIFTIGVSTVALYYTIHKCVFQDRDYCITTYFGALKDNFKQSTLTWLIMLAAGIFMAFDIFSCKPLMDTQQVFRYLLILFVILACDILIWAIYTLLYIARFTNGFKECLKIGAALAVLNFASSIVLLLTTGVFALLAYLVPGTIMFIPGLFLVAIHPMMEKIFRKVMTEEDQELEDARNGVYHSNKKED